MEGDSVRNVPILYGFTNSKEFATRFKNERSAKLFRVISSDIHKEEFDRMKHFDSRKLLKEIDLETFSKEQNRFHQITVVGTREEENQLEKTIESYITIYKNLFQWDASMFKSDIKEALHELGYDGFHLWARFEDGYCGNMKHVMEELESFRETFQFDEFGLFYRMFGGSFKKPD